MMVRRDLKHAQERLEKIEDYLARCGHLYEVPHPDIYELFCSLLTLTRLLKQGLVKLRESL